MVWRRKNLNLVGWLVAFLIVFLIFKWLGFSETAKALGMTSIPVLSLAIVVFLVTTLVRLVKWRLVLFNEHGWLETLLLFFASKAIGGLLPARVGELAPLASKKYRTEKISALIIVDRTFETYATLFLGALGFIALNFYDKTIMLLWTLVLVSLSVLFLLLIYTGLWRRLQALFRSWRSAARLFEIVERVSNGLHTFKRSFPLLIGLTFGATILDFVFAQLLFLSVGASVTLALVAAAWCASGVVSVVAFTPGGLGIADIPTVYLYTAYGTPPAQMGAVFVLIRTITIGGSLLLLAISTMAYARYSRDILSRTDLPAGQGSHEGRLG